MSHDLNIQRLSSTKILEIRYRNSNPAKIQTVLEQVAQGYLNYSLRERQTSLRQGISFVEEQLPQMRQRVNSLQQMLQELQQNYQFIDPSLRTQELTSQMSRLSDNLSTLDQQILQAETYYQNLQQVSGATIVLRSDPIYQQQLAQVQAVENQMALESSRSLDSSLEIQALQRQRDNLMPLLTQGAESALSAKLSEASQVVNSLRQQQAQLQGKSSQVQAQISQLPALSRIFSELQQELDIARSSLNRLLAAREALQLESAQKEIPWQLLVMPSTGEDPVSPNIPRNLMSGLLMGLVLGTGAAFLTDRLDNVFHSVDDLRDFSQLPLLGVIPFNTDLQAGPLGPDSVAAQEPRRNDRPKRNSGYGYGSRPLTEAFRSLAINLCFMSADSPLRSMVITSAMPGDGKSTVALNLAQAAAAMGQRVLLVDGDLRRPQIHRRLSLFNGQGLANLITKNQRIGSETLTVKDIIQPSGIEEQLWVLTSGQRPPDPSRLLSSDSMKQLNHTLQQEFDLIVYDTPPLLGLSDATLLSNQCDGIVLVAGLGRTERSAVKRALEILKTGRSNILGLVANAVKQQGNSYTDYYYSYSSYYQGYYNLMELDDETDDKPDNASSKQT